jgi:hypothetical protein
MAAGFNLDLNFDRAQIKFPIEKVDSYDQM